ncbi:hypothetical protein [Streptomyces bottropensis]|uniref:hypothetical protein n=1 Tax=Streptomyces bottropensis TaxID=42235 RepID=UPI00368C45E5
MPSTASAPIQINIPPGVLTNLLVTMVGFGMVTAAAVLGTALYGPKENSERAFRVMDWLKRSPEPEKPQPSPPARSRTRTTSRGDSVRAATLRP